MHRVLLIVLLAGGLCGGIDRSVSAEDWTEFRGPTGQGHSSARDLPLNWSPTENVAWKQTIPGNGWSSPIYYQGRLFLTTAVPLGDDEDGLDQSLRALCLDAKSGELLWERELFEQDRQSAEPIHNKNSHASATPLTDGRHLYCHFGTQGTACLTLDGDVVWKTQAIEYSPRHGNGGSPVLVGEILAVSCDGSDVQFVVGLDRRTGEIRWKTTRPEHDREQKFSFSTPLVIEVNNRAQLISPGTNAVVAYDPETGDEIWTVRYSGYSVIPRPVFAHGLVYISTGYNQPSLLAIRPTGTGDVTETHVAWQSKRAISHTPSFLVIGDELYCVSDGGIASCLDAKTGETHWQQRLGGNFSASPLYADGKIYFQSEQGETTIVRPGQEYVEVGRNHLNARTLASFAVGDSALFVRTADHLYRFEK